jgi:hypothetical protein
VCALPQRAKAPPKSQRNACGLAHGKTDTLHHPVLVSAMVVWLDDRLQA